MSTTTPNLSLIKPADNDTLSSSIGMIRSTFDILDTVVNSKAPVANPTFISGSQVLPTIIGKRILGQTANLLTLQDENNNVLNSILADGTLYAPVNGGFLFHGSANPTNILIPNATTSIGLVVKGKGVQSANLQEWQNSSGTPLARIAANGGFFSGPGDVIYGGTNTDTFAVLHGADQTNVGAKVFVQPVSSGVKPLTLRGVISQSANLTEWQNSSGTVLARIDANGIPAIVGANGFTSANQNVTGGTGLMLAFVTSDYDSSGFHSNVTNNTRFTVPTNLAGKYLITFKASFNGLASGTQATFSSYKNGILDRSILSAAVGASGQVIQSSSELYMLAAGDYLEIFATHTDGTNVRTVSSARMSVTLLGN